MEKVISPLNPVSVNDLPKGIVSRLKDERRPRGNPHTRDRVKYKSAICAFDIETSRLPAEQFGLPNDQSVMYIWQFHCYQHFTVIGRTWEQFTQFLDFLKSELGDKTLVIFVHNLSYEFQFLRHIHEFTDDEVFCVDSRKILKAKIGKNFEFRCSYLHSNMSLAQYTKKMGVEHQKLSGDDFNYSEIRYPWTELTEEQIRYCLHDVFGLCEALAKEMEIDGDNLYTFPLTSTGYVRRDVNRALHPKQRLIRLMQPEEPVYRLLVQAFRGGDTHANRYFADRVLENVTSADRSSSYPEVQINQLYPVGTWYYTDAPTPLDLKHLLSCHVPIVGKFGISNLRLKNPLYCGCPYIPIDKCLRADKPVCDNGRILSADYIEICMTDVDLELTSRQYDVDDLCPVELAYSRYGKLPEEMTNCVIEYYRRKTALKGVSGQEIYYMKSKNKLNSIYGLTAQHPAKQSILFDNGNYTTQSVPLADLLAKAYRKSVLSYAWGVWCTCWARKELHDLIDTVEHTPNAYFVYCDTDSVKYLGTVDFTAYNKAKKKLAEQTGAYADDPSGERHYMGVAEPDGKYKRFATLGAKKYAYDFGDGKTHVTIAGVTKSKGGAELDRGDLFGHGLERFVNLNPGFVFRDAGGTEIIYNDEPYGSITVDGHELYISENSVIRDSEYTLGITAEYEKILDNCDDWLGIWVVDNTQ